MNLTGIFSGSSSGVIISFLTRLSLFIFALYPGGIIMTDDTVPKYSKFTIRFRKKSIHSIKQGFSIVYNFSTEVILKSALAEFN